MTVVVGTAGHIDHGKTALLRALTGIDADRLPEERRRGMTIDVGYAHLPLPAGGELDFVDVPGHDRLVGNMLVGAGEIDAAMLVVAADDGPRAQTREHLELLDALGIADGLVVVTKVDLVDPDRRAAVVGDVGRLLAGTVLEGARAMAASATTGVGIDALRAELAVLAARIDGRGAAAVGPARLAIDRVFAVRGRGVVVTGSLRGRSLEAGATLRLEPAGRSVRVRGLQVHGAAVDRAGAGRTALNLAGIDEADVQRGMVLVAGDGVVASDRLLVALRPSAKGRRGTDPGDGLPRDRARLRLHLGTEQVEAVVGRGGREAVALATGGTAILRLARPIAVATGDRFVLRRSSPATVEAGGIVLDTRPARGISRRRADPARVTALAEAVATLDASRLSASLVDLHGAHDTRHAVAAMAAVMPRDADPRSAAPVSGQLLAADVAAAAAEAAIGAVAADRSSGRTLADARRAAAAEVRRRASIATDAASAAAAAIVDEIVAAGRLIRAGDGLALPGATVPSGPTPEVEAAMTRLVALLGVPAPPPLAEAAGLAACPVDAIRDLERSGRIVRLDADLAWATEAYRALERQAVDLARLAPLTPATLRDATGTSRKYVMAILEDLDRRALLRRTPTGHVPGPRAALATGEPGS